MIGGQLGQFPGLDAIYKQVIDHATLANDAINEVLGAIDVPNALGSAQGQAAGGSTVDQNALNAGVTKLGNALAITTLVDKIEALLGDAQVQSAIKQKAGSSNLDGAGVAAARGALKSVSPDTVGLSVKLRSVLSHLQQDSKTAGHDAQKALSQAEASISKSADEFDKQIVRFVGIVDGLIGSAFN